MGTDPYEDSYIIEYPTGEQTLERFQYEHTKSVNDIHHTVLDGETIQSIAFKYYNDSGLWYMISDANSIYNPIDEILPGMQLLIPNGGNNGRY